MENLYNTYIECTDEQGDTIAGYYFGVHKNYEPAETIEELYDCQFVLSRAPNRVLIDGWRCVEIKAPK